MSEPPKSCPFCGGAQLTKMMPGPDAWHCDGCGSDSPCWSRRAYGTGTADVLKFAHAVVDADSWSPQTKRLFAAFIAEHEPAKAVQS